MAVAATWLRPEWTEAENWHEKQNDLRDRITIVDTNNYGSARKPWNALEDLHDGAV